jgi:hypothetical protein
MYGVQSLSLYRLLDKTNNRRFVGGNITNAQPLAMVAFVSWTVQDASGAWKQVEYSSADVKHCFVSTVGPPADFQPICGTGKPTGNEIMVAGQRHQVQDEQHHRRHLRHGADPVHPDRVAHVHVQARHGRVVPAHLLVQHHQPHRYRGRVGLWLHAGPQHVPAQARDARDHGPAQRHGRHGHHPLIRRARGRAARCWTAIFCASSRRLPPIF